MVLQEHADISHLSGFHTPAKARYFIEYNGENLDELKAAAKFATENSFPILTISGGKNLLLAFDEYLGLVIHNNSQGYEVIHNERVSSFSGLTRESRSNIIPTNKEQVSSPGSLDLHFPSFGMEKLSEDDGEVGNYKNQIKLTVASGHPIWELAESLEKEHDIMLWHRFLGLPGSVWGSVFGNAGCFGLEIGPYVERVYILDLKTGMELEKTGVELDFNYRWSACKNHPEWFLLSVVCDFSELREKYPAPPEDPLAWRGRVQPEGYSCGSFFKNPSREQSAGSLIEQVWLKGHHLGGAYFSDKHANFLMSDGTASWQNLIALIQLAQNNIHEQFGIELEPEVRIIQ